MSLDSNVVTLPLTEPLSVSKDCNLLSCVVCTLSKEPVLVSRVESLESCNVSLDSNVVTLPSIEPLSVSKLANLASCKVCSLSKEPVLVSRLESLESCVACSVVIEPVSNSKDANLES